jgi:hypothetical protein
LAFFTKGDEKAAVMTSFPPSIKNERGLQGAQGNFFPDAHPSVHGDNQPLNLTEEVMNHFVDIPLGPPPAPADLYEAYRTSLHAHFYNADRLTERQTEIAVNKLYQTLLSNDMTLDDLPKLYAPARRLDFGHALFSDGFGLGFLLTNLFSTYTSVLLGSTLWGTAINALFLGNLFGSVMDYAAAQSVRRGRLNGDHFPLLSQNNYISPGEEPNWVYRNETRRGYGLTFTWCYPLGRALGSYVGHVTNLTPGVGRAVMGQVADGLRLGYEYWRLYGERESRNDLKLFDAFDIDRACERIKVLNRFKDGPSFGEALHWWPEHFGRYGKALYASPTDNYLVDIPRALFQRNVWRNAMALSPSAGESVGDTYLSQLSALQTNWRTAQHLAVAAILLNYFNDATVAMVLWANREALDPGLDYLGRHMPFLMRKEPVIPAPIEQLELNDLVSPRPSTRLRVVRETVVDVNINLPARLSPTQATGTSITIEITPPSNEWRQSQEISDPLAADKLSVRSSLSSGRYNHFLVDLLDYYENDAGKGSFESTRVRVEEREVPAEEDREPWVGGGYFLDEVAENNADKGLSESTRIRVKEREIVEEEDHEPLIGREYALDEVARLKHPLRKQAPQVPAKALLRRERNAVSQPSSTIPPVPAVPKESELRPPSEAEERYRANYQKKQAQITLAMERSKSRLSDSFRKFRNSIEFR